MTRRLLFLTLLLSSTLSFSQVAFNIIEPAAISGGYDFTSNGDGPNWGLANLNDPMDAVMDTVVLADDGTPGINAQGVPFANEACGALVNNVAGKIVMLYRYDGQSSNVCWAGTKVLNAQNAGAIGVILVNRDDNLYGYDGTTDGPSTTIPFAFITRTDGEIIRNQIDMGQDVVAFIGNKLGFYQDDVGIKKVNTLVPRESCTPSQTSLDNTEFGFDVGTMIYNYGSNTQNNINLTVEVTGPAGTWTETAGPFTLASGDSVDVFTGGTNNIPAFSFPTYPSGNYNLSYSVDLGITDSMDYDNTLDFPFVVSDDLFAYAYMDTVTGMPEVGDFTRSIDPLYTGCIVYDNPNGSRLGATGIYLAATPQWDVSFPLEGEFVTAYLYQWDDAFVDLNDAGLAFNNLNLLAEGDYIFGPGEDSAMVFAAFDTPAQLGDNQRYLACVTVWNDEVWLGHNRRIDYIRNVNNDLQPLFPSSANAVWYAMGFGAEIVPALGLKVIDEAELGLSEDQLYNAHIYPNPAQNELNISFEGFENGTVKIIDISGRIILEQTISGSFNTIDISALQSGQYIVQVSDQNGLSSEKRFAKL